MSEADRMIAAIEQAFGGKFNEPVPKEIRQASQEACLRLFGYSEGDTEAHEIIARAILAAERRGYERGRAEGLEEAERLLLEWAEKNQEYLRNAPSLQFSSEPHRGAELRRRDDMAKSEKAYRKAATAIRAMKE